MMDMNNWSDTGEKFAVAFSEAGPLNSVEHLAHIKNDDEFLSL